MAGLRRPGVERIIKTDLHNPDTDKDGLTDGYEMNVVIAETVGRDIYKEYIGVRSDPLNKDFDGDGYEDKDDPNPFTSDVHRTAIGGVEKYIPINKDGTLYYGADQSWWAEEKAIKLITGEGPRYPKDIWPNVPVIDEYGCGVIAALQYFLYIIRTRGEEYADDTVKACFSDLNAAELPYSEFTDWILNYMTLNSDDLFYYEKYDHLGIWGDSKFVFDEMAEYINEYFEDTDFWVGFFHLKYRPNEDNYNNKIKEILKRYIRANFPIPILIGLLDVEKALDWYGVDYYLDPAHNLDAKITIKIPDAFCDELVNLYESIYPEKLDQDVQVHWMTVTEIIEDDVTGKTWLKVQTWGKVRYVELNEWLNKQWGLSGIDGFIIPFLK
jgi:hypothetical protein